jgi:hypothetical protein
MKSFPIIRTTFLYPALFVVLILVSCHKSPSPISISDYPNKIGDKWIYFVQDSLNHVNDTLTVTVLSSTTLNGSASLIWQYAYSNGTVDTLLAIISGDTINYYTLPPFPTLSFGLLFPIAPGSNWKDNSQANYTASYQGSYSSLGHNFSNVYELNHTTQSFGFSLTDNIYIEPNIGIVYRKTKEFDTQPTTNQTWTLINYQLN